MQLTGAQLELAKSIDGLGHDSPEWERDAIVRSDGETFNSEKHGNGSLPLDRTA
jgi:hypothetical protein